MNNVPICAQPFLPVCFQWSNKRRAIVANLPVFIMCLDQLDDFGGESLLQFR